MSYPLDKKLDRMLEDWAKRQSGRSEDLASLRQRIVTQLTEDELLEAVLPVRAPTVARRWSWVVGLATAAALLIVVGLWQEPAQENALLDGTSPLVALENGPAPWSVHLQNQQRLLNGYREVFDQQLAWVTEEDGHIDVRLRPASSEAPDPQDCYVTIRLVLWARVAKESPWKQVRTIHVLAAREQWVESASLDNKQAQFAVWAYPIDEEVISVDLRYQLPESAGLQFEESSLLRFGKSTNLYAVGEDGVAYRLDQMADLLDAGDLG